MEISEIPKELQRNPHFARYFRTWEKNPVSIVFIPLAQICREQGFLDLARQICEKGLSRHPASVSGRLMLARIFLDQEALNESRALVEKVLEEYPAQQEATSLREKILRALGVPLKEEKKDDKKKEAPKMEAQVDQKPQTTPHAAEDVEEEATEVSTVAVSIWENPTMAKIYADQGETKIARQILEKILARDPNNARAAELKRTLAA